MKLIISGRVIGLNSLSGQLDQAFLELHAAYFGNQGANWSSFQVAAEAFFSTLPAKSPKHNEYFGNFVNIWKFHLNNGRFDEAEQIWRMALEPALHWEAAHDSEIHKGTPYYFWGATAILRGDLDKGFALMHQAAEEDKRTVGPGFTNEPAYAFATLNYDKPDQAFRLWLLLQSQFLDHLISNYALAHNRKFSLNDFRTKFLLAPPTSDILFFFTYCLARLKQFCDLPDHVVKSDFTSILQVNILSDLTLVVEAMLKDKNPKKFKPAKKTGEPPQECTFIDHAQYLLRMVRQPLKLGYINAKFKVKGKFDSTLQDILNGTFVLKNGSALKGHQTDVAIAYGIRNKAAHNVFASPVILKNFDRVTNSLLNVLFVATDFLKVDAPPG